MTSPTSPAEVYTLAFDANRYAGLLCVDENDLNLLVDRFDGAPMGSGWQAIEMLWQTEENGLPIPDFGTIAGGGLVFNARALEALDDLLEGRGELLPLQVEGGNDYYAFNITRLSDALDEERSRFKRFEDTGRIMRILRYEFDAGRLASETIFKIQQKPRSHEYVTASFRKRVEEAGLTGFTWDRCVWNEAATARAS